MKTLHRTVVNAQTAQTNVGEADQEAAAQELAALVQQQKVDQMNAALAGVEGPLVSQNLAQAQQANSGRMQELQATLQSAEITSQQASTIESDKREYIQQPSLMGRMVGGALRRIPIIGKTLNDMVDNTLIQTQPRRIDETSVNVTSPQEMTQNAQLRLRESES